MPSVIRATIDLSQGHEGRPGQASLNGSPDVIANGKPVVRIDDIYGVSHCNSDNCHDMAKAKTGSSKVIVNGKGIHRNGDSIECGDVASNGSPDVFAG